MNRKERRAAAAQERRQAAPECGWIGPPLDGPPGVHRAIKVARAMLAGTGPIVPSWAPRNPAWEFVVIVSADDAGPIVMPPASVDIIDGGECVLLHGLGYDVTIAPLSRVLARLRAFGDGENADTIERVARPGMVTIVGAARDGTFTAIRGRWVDIHKPAGIA